ncbi:MAG TPA: hypothetical protein GXX36_01165 [Clostridiaceae bacterium]|nr:hypothetical protein [Clostridiaceae bacterium]
MLKEKEMQLKNRLKDIIHAFGHRNDIKQEITNEFRLRNISSLRAAWAFSENLDLNTLTDSEEDIRFLFIFTYALKKALKEKTDIKINLEDYFTKTEIEKWSDFKEEKEQESIYPIVFKDVTQLSDRIWQTALTAQELNKLDAENLLIYNFKTQRNPKITVAGEKINMDVKKVEEIKERLLAGEQYPDQIRLNVLNTGETRPVYNSRNRTLTLNEGCIINIFDGYHRKTANALALEVNPDLQFMWSVIITYFSEKQAHDFMSQIDKQKPIKKEYIQQMDYSKPENLVIEAIMDDKLSEIAKVMKDDDSYIKLNKALTKKSLVATAIREKYNEQLNTSTNIRAVARWIVEFTDYLMGLYVDEFINNPYEVKKVSVINHKNMFFGYIALSAKLQNNRQWKELLRQKMESIDFSITNPFWKDIGMLNNKDANKSLRNKLYNLFEGDAC